MVENQENNRILSSYQVEIEGTRKMASSLKRVVQNNSVSMSPKSQSQNYVTEGIHNEPN